MLTRILTALALAPIVLVACFRTEAWPIAIVAVVATALSSIEGVPLLQGASRGPWRQVVVFLGLLVWIWAPLGAIVFLHTMQPSGTPDGWFFKSAVLLLLLPLWAGDTAAIFAGKAFGKHLMAPKISPKKTWEGGIANFVAAVLVAGALGPSIGFQAVPSWIAGALIGVLGQAGDLFQSSLKRKVGLKDSGKLLPGHGGLLDRIDSLLFAALPVTLVVYYLGTR